MNAKSLIASVVAGMALVGAAQAAITVTNFDFETTPSGGWPGFPGYTTNIPGWTATGSTGLNPGSDGTSPFTGATNTHRAFVQTSGSISQNVTGLPVGQWVRLNFVEGNRSTPPTAYSTLGSDTLYANHTVYSGGQYLSNWVKVTSATETLTLGNISIGDKTVWWDNIGFDARDFGANSRPVDNSGFELTNLATPVWSYTDGAALESSSGPYGHAAYEGGQQARIQAAGSVSQTLTGLTLGQAYTISFEAANRGTYSTNYGYSVSVGGTDVLSSATGVVGGGNWNLLTTNQFVAGGSSAIVTFSKTSNGPDSTMFLDDVVLNAIPEPASLGVLSSGAMLVLARRRRRA